VDEQKKQALKAALAQIDKQFGKGSVMFLGDEGAQADIEAVSTGSLSLDIALGIGGLPRGRVVEIYGPESSGKTTLTLHVIAEMQKLGGTAAFIDAEHALDPQYAKKLGVNTDELLISQPDTGESKLKLPVETASISACAPSSPKNITEPLPNCLSICANAAFRACFFCCYCRNAKTWWHRSIY
jgi:protein RecA